MDRKVIGHIFSSRDFVFLVQENAFISKIRDTPAVLRQLWEEEFDLGFGIRSSKTDRIAYFTLAHVEKHGDRFAWWSFNVHNPDDDPALKGLTVSVFND